MKLIRNAEIYLSRRTQSALQIAAVDEPADALADRILVEALENSHPGIFNVLEECDAAREEVKKQNQARIEVWRNQNKTR